MYTVTYSFAAALPYASRSVAVTTVGELTVTDLLAGVRTTELTGPRSAVAVNSTERVVPVGIAAVIESDAAALTVPSRQSSPEALPAAFVVEEICCPGVERLASK